MAFIQRTNSPTWGGKRGKRWWYVSLRDSTNILYICHLYIYILVEGILHSGYMYMYLYIIYMYMRKWKNVQNKSYIVNMTSNNINEPTIIIHLNGAQVSSSDFQQEDPLATGEIQHEKRINFGIWRCQKPQKTNELYHLESRWLATPISFGLSWPRKLNRHQNWELRQPSTYHY